MPDEDRRLLEEFAMWVGYGAQLVDDTLDLVADIERGLLFITAEEFEHLSLSPTQLGTAAGLRAITRLRNKWALAYYLEAYRLTSGMKLGNRRLARTWLDFGLRALLDDRVRPLHPRVLADQRRYLRHFGSHLALFDLPFPTESCRLATSRVFVRKFVNEYSVASIQAARAKYAELGPELPPGFIVRQIRRRPLPQPEHLTDDAPDGRRPVALVQYGEAGLLPVMVESLRVLLGL